MMDDKNDKTVYDPTEMAALVIQSGYILDDMGVHVALMWDALEEEGYTEEDVLPFLHAIPVGGLDTLRILARWRYKEFDTAGRPTE